MMCIVCRCDVADWIPKIGHENMALLLERAAWSCNVTKLWWYCNCAESGKPFPQQFSLPKTPAKGTHTLGSPLCLGETSLASTYTSPTRLNTFTPPDDLVHIQKKKKRSKDPRELFGVGFSALFWSRVGHLANTGKWICFSRPTVANPAPSLHIRFHVGQMDPSSISSFERNTQRRRIIPPI